MDSVAVKADSGKLELAVHAHILPYLTGICDFVKAGSRNASKNPDNSVYCNAPVIILDLNAISRTTMRIEIYVKDIDGFKNSTKLSEIRDALVPVLGGVTLNDSYFVAHVSDITGKDNAGFSYVFLNLAVTIV